ncbi:YtkA-like [Gracilibacillus ureilyticus]|uniref:YtkA-like n=1 Tax=Gracilibacillus ureilyticus TaxID=531814 RepID=A0A1H9U7L0_9BACI|nr:FixH family protein [Gracilibacillus ureilyticus]SES05251.1 YtkA-like [Gracilibacillus ureilyticus]
MKKNAVILLLVLTATILSACSLEPEVEKRYKQENPLVADIIIPETLSHTELSTFEVILQQEGAEVEDADFVHFEIWKQDGSIKYGMEEANEIGNGIYQISKRINRDGLYYIKVHAGNNGSLIMPQKQFVVGELSENELEFLQSGAKVENQTEESHH